MKIKYLLLPEVTANLRVKVPTGQLQKTIHKWIFMSTITGFYTGSTESEVEKQFADLRSVKTGAEFVDYLDSVATTRFTKDYFK